MFSAATVMANMVTGILTFIELELKIFNNIGLGLETMVCAGQEG